MSWLLSRIAHRSFRVREKDCIAFFKRQGHRQESTNLPVMASVQNSRVQSSACCDRLKKRHCRRISAW